jgi:hypothetical protein
MEIPSIAVTVHSSPLLLLPVAGLRSNAFYFSPTYLHLFIPPEALNFLLTGHFC